MAQSFEGKKVYNVIYHEFRKPSRAFNNIYPIALNIIQDNQEEIIELALGNLKNSFFGQNGLLIYTDKRLLFVGDRAAKNRVTEWAIEKVTDPSWKKRFLGNEVSFQIEGKTIIIKGIIEGRADAIVHYLKNGVKPQTALQVSPTLEKIPVEHKESKNEIAIARTNSEELVTKDANPSSPFEKWYISISFGHSTSKNFLKAITLAKKSDQYIETKDENENIIYQAVYSAIPESYLNFIKLYELIGNWKSSFVMIDGKLVDRKIVSRINYCFGDKARSGNKDFCFGASEYTVNPFGCHRLQISSYNHPWWSFGMYDTRGVWRVDKKAIKERIMTNAKPYLLCPAFSMSRIIEVLNSLPDKLDPRRDKDWDYLTDGAQPKGFQNFGELVMHITVDDTDEFQGNSQKNNIQIGQSNAADEILKYKHLLDVGAITQGEYEEKKHQLLNL